MSRIRLLLSLLQISLFQTVQAASPSSPLQKAPLTRLETPNLIVTNHASDSSANPDSSMWLRFVEPGSPIPAAELRHTLSVAKTEVEAHIPGRAHEPLYTGSFEKNITFPETGDSVYLWVYPYGVRFSWVQLSQTLALLEKYVRGLDPSHPGSHYQEVEFYLNLTPSVEAARGGVEFKPGSRAVAKRNPDTTILQLPAANLSPHVNADLPIIFNIPKSNLDLNVTTLGNPIPKDTLFEAIEAAFTDIVLKHDNIDLTVPKNLYPYQFNYTDGKFPKYSKTMISISAFPGNKFSWGLLCILYYGLRDFLRDTEHFNTLIFRVNEKKVKTIGHGEIVYWPVEQDSNT